MIMDWVYDDGGRAQAGYRGSAGDCVCRSICIATGRSYVEVYTMLAHGQGNQRATKRSPKRSKSARNGINTNRKWFKDYMSSMGFEWVPLMKLGQGFTHHLCENELPKGKLVVALRKHYAAVIDGVLYDTHNWAEPEVIVGFKDGQPFRSVSYRGVYGYWILKEGLLT